MPKAKPNKAAKSRFKLTGTGKLVRSKQGRRHHLTKKAPKRKRHLQQPALVSESYAKLYRRLLGGV